MSWIRPAVVSVDPDTKVVALGDRSQVVANLVYVMAGKPPTVRYEGYASCPLTLSRRSILLAEFDCLMTPTPSIPLINTRRERRDRGYLKRYGIPALYSQGMLRGIA